MYKEHFLNQSIMTQVNQNLFIVASLSQKSRSVSRKYYFTGYHSNRDTLQKQRTIEVCTFKNCQAATLEIR